MDNGMAEYTFVARFIDPSTPMPVPSSPLRSPRSGDVPPEFGGFSFAGPLRSGTAIVDTPPPIATPERTHTTKEQQALLDATWKHVLHPVVLEYCQACPPFQALLPYLTHSLTLSLSLFTRSSRAVRLILLHP